MTTKEKRLRETLERVEDDIDEALSSLVDQGILDETDVDIINQFLDAGEADTARVYLFSRARHEMDNQGPGWVIVAYAVLIALFFLGLHFL